MEKRLKYIDALKGLGIILVVLGHTILEYLYPIDLKYFFLFNSLIYIKYNVLYNFIYSFHIPLFFIISGYLIYHKYQNNFNDINYKNLIKKTIIPYEIFSIIAITINLIVDFYFGDNFVENLNKNIVYTLIFDGFSALWFLPTLLISKTIFLFINKNFSQKQKCILYIVLTIITYFFSLNYNFYYWINNSINIKTIFVLISNIINRSIIGTIFIMIGYTSYYFINNQSNKILNIIISIIIIFINIVLSMFNEGVDLHYSVINNPILYYYLAISTSISLIVLFKLMYNKFFIPLEFLGKNSLLIMCTHYPFQIIRVLSHYIKTNNVYTNEFIIFIFTMIIEIIIIILINELKKKTVKT